MLEEFGKWVKPDSAATSDQRDAFYALVYDALQMVIGLSPCRLHCVAYTAGIVYLKGAYPAQLVTSVSAHATHSQFQAFSLRPVHDAVHLMKVHEIS